MQKIKNRGKLLLMVSIVLFISLFLCGFMPAERTAIVYAAEDDIESEISPEDGPVETDEPVDVVEGEVPPTVLSRAEEWFKNNLAEFFSGATLITAFSTVVAVVVTWRKNKRLREATDAILANVNLNTSNNTASNIEAIKAINTLIEKYNEVQEYIMQLDEKERLRDAICNEMVTFGKAILEILATVYANNQNLPQGIKDIVSLKYANALKAAPAEEFVKKEG